MKVTVKTVVRLDGPHIHIQLVPAENQGDTANWMLSEEAANALRDELVRILPAPTTRGTT